MSLGRKLGQGGEGAVLEVSSQSDLVAKIYHNAASPEKTAKLTAMVRLKTERLLKLSAWPINTLHEQPGGAVKGFVMPKVVDHQDIHILYGIKSRHAEYPEARWPFLIQAAANVARAFIVIHEHGHVIGDVNQGGVVVSKSATVRLVDCDSFQVSVNGYRYLCEVGVPTHTPPELQDRSFKGVVRTQDHDAFGLAVIIFQLLFMGRHPFSGAFLGRGDMPLERAIKEFRFAYGPGAATRQMKQPPATLPLEAISAPLVRYLTVLS
jgi:DNA-binding helix-hairpin-helix protein with protein kinase domain